ncbi:MAG: Arm DNA-binding domain-containing protein [Xanthobacteraceae bacterium]
MEKRGRIGQRHIKALGPDQTIWDSAVSGFGARRQKSDARSYFVFYRTAEGRQRWHTIGRHGAPWTPELARNEAVKILGQVAEGNDPAADKQSKRRPNQRREQAPQGIKQKACHRSKLEPGDCSSSLILSPSQTAGRARKRDGD